MTGYDLFPESVRVGQSSIEALAAPKNGHADLGKIDRVGRTKGPQDAITMTVTDHDPRDTQVMPPATTPRMPVSARIATWPEVGSFSDSRRAYCLPLE